MRALSSGELPAIRDNRNAWQIQAEAVDRWAANRSGHSPDTDRSLTEDQREPDRTTPADTPETRLAVAETKLAAVTAERDRLAGLLEKALEARPVVQTVAPVSFWARLFGGR